MMTPTIAPRSCPTRGGARNDVCACGQWEGGPVTHVEQKLRLFSLPHIPFLIEDESSLSGRGLKRLRNAGVPAHSYPFRTIHEVNCQSNISRPNITLNDNTRLASFQNSDVFVYDDRVIYAAGVRINVCKCQYALYKNLRGASVRV